MLYISTLPSLSGHWWPLRLGLVSALWGGLSVVRVTQSAFDSAWEVPYADRAKLGRHVSAPLPLAGQGLSRAGLSCTFLMEST